MIFLRTMLFNLAFYGSTIVMCSMLLWGLLLPRRSMLGIIHLWVNQVAWIEQYIGGIRYQVIGSDLLPTGACIIAAKHQSAWETMKLHRLFGDPAIVLKKELLNLPIWGWFLRRSGMIPIDRSAGSDAITMMVTAARQAVVENRKIVIFPQGTRVAPGQKRPYKSGVAALYHELGLPVVPMALNSGLLWGRNSFIKKPGLITVKFLPPIMPGLSRSALMSQLESDLEQASNSLPDPFA